MTIFDRTRPATLQNGGPQLIGANSEPNLISIFMCISLTPIALWAGNRSWRALPLKLDLQLNRQLAALG
jgi:hypothetical protein